MTRRFEIYVDPEYIHDSDHIRRLILQQAPKAFEQYRIVRRSIDARRRSRPRYLLQVALDGDTAVSALRFAPVPASPSVIVVGAGPAGYFAALELIERGVRPIVLERGPGVEIRRKRIARLLRSGDLDPDANYCFGEGGAGAFSDGKLFTRSHKRGDIRKVLDILIYHGASPDIRVDAHPHIGSDKLPTLIQRIRRTIVDCGGAVHFSARVSDFPIRDGAIRGVRLADGTQVDAEAVILAVGHSARDIYTGLFANGIGVEAKPLAVGVRVEHPQAIIDAIQYRRQPRQAALPPATYRLATQCAGRGVYSFCMCPGGMIVPTATRAGELAVNGMSYSRRRGLFANAGLVVEVRPEDVDGFDSRNPLAFVAFQEDLERRAFIMGGGANQQAPAQRMTDFMTRSVSADLPETSYLQGLNSAPLHELFAPALTNRLREALALFDRRLKGFLTRDAVLIGVESRTSAPVRILRHPETLMHPQVAGLFPCGEGAGYAGGITSSALDGQRVARQAARFVTAGLPG